LPRRQFLLFLAALLGPCLFLLAFGLRLLDQERQLEQKRIQEERQRQADRVGQELLTLVERIRLDLALTPDGRPHPAVVFVGKWREGRLEFPWDAPSKAQPVCDSSADSAFCGRLRQAEHAELVAREFDSAAQGYGEAIQAARQPGTETHARLRLARTLAKLDRRAQARIEYERVLRTPSAVVDEYGIPLGLYAAPPLLATERGRNEVLALIWRHLEGLDRLPAPALYMLRDLAQEAGSGEVVTRLAERIQDREQAVGLQRDFARLMPVSRTPEPMWVPFGDPPWLVSIPAAGRPAEGLVIALRATDLFSRLSPAARGVELARGNTGEPLGENFPGLLVTLPALDQTGAASRRIFLLLALVLVLGLTLFAGHLLWRDVRREARLAEMRSQFVSSVSHELKTPLATIRVFSEMMRLGDELDRDTQCQHLDTITQETARLSRLVDNVLAFARIEQGKQVYRTQSVALAGVIDAAARAIEYPARESGFQLEISADGDLPPVSGDRDALEQAVLNLLSNAMKYSGESRRIGLHLSRDESAALIRVVDHGIGIPNEEQTRIFERFYRVPSTENEHVPGTGLGLTLVDHIIKAHGGSVEVESAPGKGSTFTLRLPLGNHS